MDSLDFLRGPLKDLTFQLTTPHPHARNPGPRAVLLGKGEEVGREIRDLAVAAAGRLRINFPEDPAFPSFRSRLAAPRPVPPPLGAFCSSPGWDSDFNPTGPRTRETPGSPGVASAEVDSCRADDAN